MSTCAVCDQPTKNKCSNCNQSFYCCAEHQKQHWKTHKVNCRPFKVEYSDQLGRYLVATRSIKPFEIILKEAPLANKVYDILLKSASEQNKKSDENTRKE